MSTRYRSFHGTAGTVAIDALETAGAGAGVSMSFDSLQVANPSGTNRTVTLVHTRSGTNVEILGAVTVLANDTLSFDTARAGYIEVGDILSISASIDAVLKYHLNARELE